MSIFFRYRYCLVLVERTNILDQSALVIGCSDILPLVPTSNTTSSVANTSQPLSYVTSLQASVTSLGTIQAYVELWTRDPLCLLTISVYVQGDVIAQKNSNCTGPLFTLRPLPWSSVYQVCATLGEFPSDKPLLHCITIINPFPKPLTPAYTTSGPGRSSHVSLLNVSNVLSLCLLLLCTLIMILICILLRKICRSPRNSTIHHHACFIPVAQKEDEIISDTPRYVKLQATTILWKTPHYNKISLI